MGDRRVRFNLPSPPSEYDVQLPPDSDEEVTMAFCPFCLDELELDDFIFHITCNHEDGIVGEKCTICLAPVEGNMVEHIESEHQTTVSKPVMKPPRGPVPFLAERHSSATSGSFLSHPGGLDIFHQHSREEEVMVHMSVCPFCDDEFEPSDFIDHIQEFHDDEIGDHNCTICQAPVMEDMVMHIVSEHRATVSKPVTKSQREPVLLHPAPQSRFTLDSFLDQFRGLDVYHSNVSQHPSADAEKEVDMYICPFCGKEFEFNDYLVHIPNEHPVEKTNGECPFCEKMVGSKMTLHLTLDHGGLITAVKPKQKPVRGPPEARSTKEEGSQKEEKPSHGDSRDDFSPSGSSAEDDKEGSVPKGQNEEGGGPSGEASASHVAQEEPTRSVDTSISEKERHQRAEFVRDLLLS